MKLTCAARGGVGIAAPQVGVARQVFIAHLSHGTIVAVNPSIVVSGARTTAVEGCLSIPGAECSVERFSVVTLHALDHNLEPFELTASGWDARIIQHEFDHLQGVVISDR
jgi:peptide deformylase